MEHVSLLHRSVSAVIWALPFCPSPFLPHISAAFSLTRHAGCTFSIRSISLGWLIQFSRFRWEVLYCPLILRIGERSFCKVFSKKSFWTFYELSDWGGEFLCPLTPRIGKGLFRKVFLKKFKKFLSRPIQRVFWLDGSSFNYVSVSCCTMPGNAFSVSCKLLRYKFR